MMCPKHEDLYNRWLNYKSRPPIRLITIGTENTRNVMLAQKARADDTWALIAKQTADIRQFCRDGRGCSDEPIPIPEEQER